MSVFTGRLVGRFRRPFQGGGGGHSEKVGQVAPQRTGVEGRQVLGRLAGNLAAQVVVHAVAQPAQEGGRGGDVQALAVVAAEVLAEMVADQAGEAVGFLRLEVDPGFHGVSGLAGTVVRSTRAVGVDVAPLEAGIPVYPGFVLDKRAVTSRSGEKTRASGIGCQNPDRVDHDRYLSGWVIG